MPRLSPPVADERLNFKNIARYEMQDLLKELIKEKALSEKLSSGVDSISNEKSVIGEQIKAINKQDLAKYKAKMEGEPQPVS